MNINHTDMEFILKITVKDRKIVYVPLKSMYVIYRDTSGLIEKPIYYTFNPGLFGL